MAGAAPVKIGVLVFPPRLVSTSTPASRLPIAVIGVGLIGRAHVARALASSEVSIAAIADPTEAGRAFAAGLNLPWYADHRAMIDTVKPAAAIVATPNATHLTIGLDCIARGIVTLMEKPVADTVANGRRLCDAATAAGVALLTGHQRRHNPIVRRARQLVNEGVLGRPVSATAMSVWLKPAPYFDTTWRREPGGGPVLINLIHDIDLLRHLLGDIVTVQAITSNRVRGFAVEDTAAVLLQFANGALGTVSVSDSVAAPWNYDLAAGEQAHYPRQDVDSHYLCGTEGSLTLPRLQVWRYRGTSGGTSGGASNGTSYGTSGDARGWTEPLSLERTPVHTANPYDEQLRHLRAVVEGREKPLCSGIDGLKTLEATQAVLTAGASGQAVHLSA